MALIVFLDDSEDLRALMPRFIRRLGLECLCAGGLDDLIKSKEAVISSRLAILDLNLGEGKPSGLDAYEWLQKHDYQGKICFFTGHAQSHPLVEAAHRRGIGVLEKPLKTEELLRLIRSAVTDSAD